MAEENDKVSNYSQDDIAVDDMTALHDLLLSVRGISAVSGTAASELVPLDDEA